MNILVIKTPESANDSTFNPDETDFFSTGVYVFSKIDGKLCIIFGKNAKYNNITGYGGYCNDGETVLDTAIREFMEESLEQLCDAETARNMFLQSAFILKKEVPKKGTSYNFLINLEVDFRKCKQSFEERLEREGDELPKDWKENATLVAVTLDELFEKVPNAENIKEMYVEDIDGDTQHLRFICHGTLKWLSENRQYIPN